MKRKSVPITFKPCIGRVPEAVKILIERLYRSNFEASKKIRFVLMANSGLNQAQKDALREALTILEKRQG